MNEKIFLVNLFFVIITPVYSKMYKRIRLWNQFIAREVLYRYVVYFPTYIRYS